MTPGPRLRLKTSRHCQNGQGMITGGTDGGDAGNGGAHPPPTIHIAKDEDVADRTSLTTLIQTVSPAFFENA